MKNYLESEKICKIANNIFGDIVVSALVEYYCDDDKESIKINEIENKYNTLDENDDSLSFDSDTIILFLKNGNKVELTNSEWGSISKCYDF